ncbi:MAG TPA: preprotein translocase subunit SecG [Ignavibacteriales bacterium]|jgi:preprotein translocase subunit SecG|nr:preprotein translocase subunit SecG [Ignavibacteriales bacterium]
MFWVIISLIFVLSVILILAILMQSSKGNGLAGTFGGQQVGAVFGTRRTADFLQKATWWLGAIIVVLILLANLVFLPGKDTVKQVEVPTQQKNQK